MFASIPYLVVEYDGGREKQCTYKYEEQVDQLLAYLKRVRPEIKQVSAAAEVRLEERVREQPPKPELTGEALDTLKALKAAEAVLEKRPDLYLELSKSARAKRQLFLKAAQRRGGAVKAKEQPILDRAEVYSGCYARVSINFYAFNTNGNKGIACGLGNIQKVRDGEPLSGRTSAADDFATDLDDDFLS